MGVAKLDMYNFIVLPGVIRILMESTRDPAMSDILSEIENSGGNIFADGDYYSYLGYDIYNEGNQTFMEIQVVQSN